MNVKRIIVPLFAVILTLSFCGCLHSGSGPASSDMPTGQAALQPTETPSPEPTAEPTAAPTAEQTVPSVIELAEVMSIPAVQWELGGQEPAGAADSLRYYTDAGVKAPADYCVHGGYLYVLDSGNGTIRCFDIESGERVFDLNIPGSSLWACAWCGDSLYVLDYDDVLRVTGPDSYEKAFSVKDNYPEVPEFKASLEYQVALASLPEGESIPAGLLEYSTRQLTSMHSLGGVLYLNFSNDYHDASEAARTARIHMEYAEGRVSVHEGEFTEGMLVHDEYYANYAPLMALPEPYAYPLSGVASIPFKQDDVTGEYYMMLYLEERAVLYRAHVEYAE